LDTQLVDESASTAAVGPVAGTTLGSAVESDAELDTEPTNGHRLEALCIRDLERPINHRLAAE